MQSNRDSLVFILCLTFNHVKYIVDAMRGFVMQETNFPYVAVVVDDASTDGGPEVIKRFLEKEFDMASAVQDETEDYLRVVARHKTNENCTFVTIFLKYNHYCKKSKKSYYQKWWDDSKYIAICEGDDYWTDPLKLQKQVDFLEGHEEYSVVCTRYARFWQKYGKYECDGFMSFLFPNNEEDADFTLEAFPWIPQVLTVMYKRDLPEMLNHTFYKNLKYKYDVPFYYAVLRFFKVRIINQVTGIYRKHDGGVYSGLTGCQSVSRAVETYWDIYQNDPTDIIRDLLMISLSNYGYQYVKFEKSVKISEMFRTLNRFNQVSHSLKSSVEFMSRLMRASIIRVIKRPYRNLKPVEPDIQKLSDTF